MQSLTEMPGAQFNAAVNALQRYERRQTRGENPEGRLDGVRWYPRGRDAEVMTQVRAPSRAWPWSYRDACRSLAHCERFENAEHADVLEIKRHLKQAGITSAIDERAESLFSAIRASHRLHERLPHGDAWLPPVSHAGKFSSQSICTNGTAIQDHHAMRQRARL
jgi:hypothetical protein